MQLLISARSVVRTSVLYHWKLPLASQTENGQLNNNNNTKLQQKQRNTHTHTHTHTQHWHVLPILPSQSIRQMKSACHHYGQYGVFLFQSVSHYGVFSVSVLLSSALEKLVLAEPMYSHWHCTPGWHHLCGVCIAVALDPFSVSHGCRRTQPSTMYRGEIWLVKLKTGSDWFVWVSSD